MTGTSPIEAIPPPLLQGKSARHGVVAEELEKGHGAVGAETCSGGRTKLQTQGRELLLTHGHPPHLCFGTWGAFAAEPGSPSRSPSP